MLHAVCETATPRLLSKFHKSVAGPKPLADFVSRANPPCPFQQENQQAKGKVLEPYPCAAAGKPAFLQIQIVGSDAISERFRGEACKGPLSEDGNLHTIGI
jgi:hypothetical protein